MSALFVEASRLERVPHVQQHISDTFFYGLPRGPVCLLVQCPTASTDAVALSIPNLFGMAGNLILYDLS